MSKAFTKDDDSAGDNVVVAPRRAPLPEGVPNYVTPRGLELLREELEQLSRAAPDAREGTELERARRTQRARLLELESRIHGAVVVRAEAQPQGEVRFGAQVTVRSESGAERVYRLVGVDEADAERGLLAFVSPLGRALLGKRVGEVALVSTPAGEDELEIIRIVYG